MSSPHPDDVQHVIRSPFSRRARAILHVHSSSIAVAIEQQWGSGLTANDRISVGPQPELEQARYFDDHYQVAASYLLKVGEKIELRDTDADRCRFCTQRAPAVTFKKEAHALPHALGNKSLTSSFECDTCNEGFGQTIENDLGAWTLPMRWLAQIRGNGGLPKLKKGSNGGWRLDADENGQRITQREDEIIAEMDEANRSFHLKLRRDPYHPVGVYKALVKIALTILPERELIHFADTLKWIRERDHSRKLMHPLVVLSTFVPGPRPFDDIELWLLLRRNKDAAVPYAIFVIAFGNEMLQLVVPSSSQDGVGAGKPLNMTYFPSRFDRGRGLGGSQLKRSRIDLSSPERVKGDVVPATFSFEGGRCVEADGTERSL